MSQLPFEEPREQECKKQAKVLVCCLEGEADRSETTAEKKQNEREENDGWTAAALQESMEKTPLGGVRE